jgi:hypothetical protein
LREGGLAEAGRAVQQHVVERLAPRAGRLDENSKIFPRCALANEFCQGLRAERRLCGVFLPPGRGDGAVGVTQK